MPRTTIIQIFALIGAFMLGAIAFQQCAPTPKCPDVKPKVQYIPGKPRIVYLPDTSTHTQTINNPQPQNPVAYSPIQKPPAQQVTNTHIPDTNQYSLDFGDTSVSIKVNSKVADNKLIQQSTTWKQLNTIPSTERVDTVNVFVDLPKRNKVFIGTQAGLQNQKFQFGPVIHLLNKKENLFSIGTNAMEKQPNGHITAAIKLSFK